MSSEEEIARLRRRVAELEEELSSVKSNHPARTKIQQMSAEVVDSNPYRSGYPNPYLLLRQPLSF